MTKWVDGVEYSLNTDYSFEVWEPVSVLDITSTGTTTAVSTQGIESVNGLMIESLGTVSESSIQQISQGDIPNTVLVAGMPYGVTQDMTGDWACYVEILDYSREVISPARDITETIDNSGGIESFKAQMLSSESALMINEYTRNRPAGYFWLITVENEAIPFRRTLEIEIAVSKR